MRKFIAIAPAILPLLLSACGNSAPSPMSIAEAEGHILHHDVARYCVAAGQAGDLQMMANLIAFKKDIIDKRIPAGQQASIRSQFPSKYPTPQRHHCNEMQLLAAQLANMQAEENAAEARQAQVNQRLIQMQAQQYQIQQSRPKTTLCTNFGGGMVGCNSY